MWRTSLQGSIRPSAPIPVAVTGATERCTGRGLNATVVAANANRGRQSAVGRIYFFIMGGGVQRNFDADATEPGKRDSGDH